MSDARLIRPASPQDAASCAAIYAHYVRDTAVSFETEPPSEQEMARRIETSTARYAWLVLEEEGAVVGFAFAGAFRPREAYRFTCEVSVYLETEHRGAGRGRALYDALLPRLRERGYRRAIAVVAQPNPASDRLHERLGFTRVGVLENVGRKHGAWHDVAWFQLDLIGGEDPDEEPDEPR
ncbi:GNAT family N-acetyltransferase [Brachybacterium endophyticum]|uniref:GNAT family N-acetyltransferase n=1 Tax=Brachybacterium endophyticum TaxID=2182385 RepID=A0A2U2RJG0_9MICO|nr:GNAT family N-acetyltransferase [Brachybacterium endophyticum]PWH05986.1 GNAT family N-acetyltransferase [Brachybacterium endophyticum]